MIDVPAKMIPTSPLFDGPVYLEPMDHTIHKAAFGVKLGKALEYFEVYAQTEVGKLLFQGWRVNGGD